MSSARLDFLTLKLFDIVLKDLKLVDIRQLRLVSKETCAKRFREAGTDISLLSQAMHSISLRPKPKLDTLSLEVVVYDGGAVVEMSPKHKSLARYRSVVANGFSLPRWEHLDLSHWRYARVNSPSII